MVNDNTVKEAFIREDGSNISESIEEMAIMLGHLGSSITPSGAAGGIDPSGGVVTSLTEAVLSVSYSLDRIAQAIENHGERDG